MSSNRIFSRLLPMLQLFLRPTTSLSLVHQTNRSLWTYVARAFNLVDTGRLEQVGPDRLCAEWVLKNSGAVCFTVSPGKYISDYNVLPPENVRLEVKEIDATGSSVMKIGFDHLKGCKKIDKIILNSCKHLEDGGLDRLVLAKDSLLHLEVINCPNMMDACLMAIKQLNHLQYLKISDMFYVKNIDIVKQELSSALPNCRMDISK